MTLHEKHLEWIGARGLNVDLAARLGLETRRDESGFWLTVPYVENGETVNHKWRKVSQKQHRIVGQGAGDGHALLFSAGQFARANHT